MEKPLAFRPHPWHGIDYKAIPGETAADITVEPVYDAPHARNIIEAAREDYRRHFGRDGS